MMDVTKTGDIHLQFPYQARFVIVIWLVLSVVVTLAGNIAVLIATLKYNAIKFERILVILITNIAAVDIIHVVTITIPTIWSVCSDQDMVKEFFETTIFGKITCFYVAHFQFWLTEASTIMICALSVTKLFCLRYPLNVSVRSARYGYIIVVFSWVPYLPRLAAVLAEKSQLRYGSWRDAFKCLIDGNKLTRDVDLICGLLSIIFPAFMTSISTVWLMQFAWRKVGLQKQIIIAYISISIIFILTFLPYGAFIIWDSIGLTPQTKDASDFLWLTAASFRELMSFSNPIIYYFSCAGFKNFVNSCCVSFYIAIHRCCSFTFCSRQTDQHHVISCDD